MTRARAKSISYDRSDRSFLSQWWWTVDRPLVYAVLALMLVGAVLVTAGSPPVAERIGVDRFHFVHRQYAFLFISIFVMFGMSLLSPLNIRRVAAAGFIGSLLLMMVLPFVGEQVKGAHRWINLAGIAIQPSEFLKPCFAVFMAWIFAERHRKIGFPGFRIAIIFYALTAFLLIIQPDFGMTVTVTGMWMLQFFLAGLPFYWMLVMGGGALVGSFAAYHFLPHVAKRIDRFLDPSSGDNYQVAKSLEAFQNGGLFGRGPGEGQVKQFLPDSHTDFIFSVAGEEFGVLACLVILFLFAFVVMRGFTRIWKETDLYLLLAVAGLLAQFGIQAIVNMGVAVNLLPAKGMTLPFLSYGGSSILAEAIALGMVLALTRRRYGETVNTPSSRIRVREVREWAR